MKTQQTWQENLHNLVSNTADAWHDRAMRDARAGIFHRQWYMYYTPADPSPGGHWGGLAVKPATESCDWTLNGPAVNEYDVCDRARRFAWLRNASSRLPIIGPDGVPVERRGNR